jgi:hypothetical protein
MEIIRDSVVMRALRIHTRGCGSFEHATHTVVELSLYRGEERQRFAVVRLVELGTRVEDGLDPSSTFSLPPRGGPDQDLLHTHYKLDKSLDTMERILTSDPPAPASHFRQSALTYLLFNALTESPPICVGCFPRRSFSGTAAASTLRVLDRVSKCREPRRPSSAHPDRHQLEREIDRCAEEVSASPTERKDLVEKLESLRRLRHSLDHGRDGELSTRLAIARWHAANRITLSACVPHAATLVA